ncbi:hypothetical protein AVEN_226116-1, partial [Araneus ventricosus]
DNFTNSRSPIKSKQFSAHSFDTSISTRTEAKRIVRKIKKKTRSTFKQRHTPRLSVQYNPYPVHSRQLLILFEKANPKSKRQSEAGGGLSAKLKHQISRDDHTLEKKKKTKITNE